MGLEKQNYNSSYLFLGFSYEERLKMMVLREEFFPLMEEVKNSVGVMSKAANGNTLHTLS